MHKILFVTLAVILGSSYAQAQEREGSRSFRRILVNGEQVATNAECQPVDTSLVCRADTGPPPVGECPPPGGVVCDERRLCDCYTRIDGVCTLLPCVPPPPPDPCECGRNEDGTCKPCPPPPPPCPCGSDNGECLPCPPSPPPPVGGDVGYGAVTQGGAGGDVFQVTTLADSGPGSLRDGITNRKGPREVQFKVGGTIALATPLPVRWPYLTVDCTTAPFPGVTVFVSQGQGIGKDPEFSIKATHDIIIRGCRIGGSWVKGQPTINTGTMSVDGDAAYNGVSWDPNPQACGPTAAHLRNSCRIVVDQNTFSGAADSGTDFWCGIKDLTFSRNLVIDSYHPRGTGCKGVYAESHPHARVRITEYANVYSNNGERSPKLLEGVYDYDFVNNIVHDWWGYGTLIDDDGAVDRANFFNNVWLATKQDNPVAGFPNDCIFGDSPKYDVEDALLEDGFHFAGNVFSPGHNPAECKSTKKGLNPFPRPYILVVHPPNQLKVNVLDVVGAPHKTPAEQATLAAAAAALQARVPQQ